MELPDDLYYTKEHEWVKVVSEKEVLIGITSYAQEKLGDVVFVELPEVDEQLKENDSFGSIESVKAVSDIYTPVAGLVKDANSILQETPETVNQDPYEEAWLIKVEVESTEFVKDLMDADEYENFIEQAQELV